MDLGISAKNRTGWLDEKAMQSKIHLVPQWAEFTNPNALTVVSCFPLLSPSLSSQGSNSRSRAVTTDQCQKDICIGQAAVCEVLCLEFWICKFASQLLPKDMLEAEFCLSLTRLERRADE